MRISNVAPSAGSASALRWLDEHGDAMYRYAMMRVRSSAAAEDLVQEALLAALGAQDRFDGNSSEQTWLIGILRHKILDYLRRLPHLEESGQGLDDLFDHKGNWKVRTSSWGANPHALAERAEFRAVLGQCLSKLPARIANAFWMREAEAADAQEVCRELGLSPANLWTMLHRARLRLRQCLTLNWFGEHK